MTIPSNPVEVIHHLSTIPARDAHRFVRDYQSSDVYQALATKKFANMTHEERICFAMTRSAMHTLRMNAQDLIASVEVLRLSLDEAAIENLNIIAGLLTVLASRSQDRQENQDDLIQVLRVRMNNQYLNLSALSLVGYVDEYGFQNASLSRANLSGANLEGANLQGVILCETDLAYAEFSRANLVGARLMGMEARSISSSYAKFLSSDMFDNSLENRLARDIYEEAERVTAELNHLARQIPSHQELAHDFYKVISGNLFTTISGLSKSAHAKSALVDILLNCLHARQNDYSGIFKPKKLDCDDVFKNVLEHVLLTLKTEYTDTIKCDMSL
jgi:uncharacterized protein YjbI with pentapeptide repeats